MFLPRQMKRMINSFGALLVLGIGCSERPVPWELPPVSDCPFHGRWVQSLNIEHEGHVLTLMAVIESDGMMVTVVGLSPLGQRILRITWTQGKIAQETDPNITVPIDGSAILRDVVFAHWPVQALQKVFAHTDWQIIQKKQARILLWHGHPWMTVESLSIAADASAESILVNHLIEGYQVRVTTVENDEP
jgi:uncharacterized protein DUF3261